jgi:hypothetical protein
MTPARGTHPGGAAFASQGKCFLRTRLQGAKAGFLQLLSFQLPLSVPRANVLLLGPAGAGKSSLVSTLDSLLSGALTRRADYGDSTTSLTLALRHYTFTAGVEPDTCQ